MARAKLTGYGNSVHRAASTANGQVTLVSPKGQIRQAFAELLGVNASKGLLLLLSKDNRETSVRCAVADFSVKDGIMTSNQIVADTGVVLAKRQGHDRPAERALDLRIDGDSKKPRLVRLFIPITIKGPFMAPKVGLEARRRGGPGRHRRRARRVALAPGRHPALRHRRRGQGRRLRQHRRRGPQRRRAGQGGPDDPGEAEEVGHVGLQRVPDRGPVGVAEWSQAASVWVSRTRLGVTDGRMRYAQPIRNPVWFMSEIVFEARA
jgi:hypothetical protein